MTTLFVLLRLLLSEGAAEALQRTAPEPIDLVTAQDNVVAAMLAGIIYRLDPDLLLAIGAHESHYQTNAVGPEAGGMVSCGVMTPEPVARCAKVPTLLDGYMAGARHLRVDWMAATSSQHEALLGYAGGWKLIRACRVGPYVVERRNGEIDLCKTDQVFLWRAAWIRRERSRAARPSS